MFGWWPQFLRRSPRRISERHPLHFWHIPKTAGTSARKFFADRFPIDAVCPAGDFAGLLALPPERANRNYSLYIGHFYAGLDRHLGKRTIKVTLLRDPVERTISHFAFIKAQADHPEHKLVCDLTIAECVRSPTTRHMMQNFQAVCLALPYGAPETTADNVLFRKAMQTLKECAVVGTAETADLTFSRIAERFDLLPHTPFPPCNVTPRTEIIDEATLRLIQKATQIDRELYDFASELVTRPKWSFPSRAAIRASRAAKRTLSRLTISSRSTVSRS
ncbi:MAG TPA: sulfotransferase family 2 domain-containing protein [Aestuariivirgaceae bacterium]